MFGFEPTAMRAAVSRLTSAGLLESDARGWYRPAATHPLLPPDLIRADLRRALTERMVEYERVGRRRWRERLETAPFVARALH